MTYLEFGNEIMIIVLYVGTSILVKLFKNMVRAIGMPALVVTSHSKQSRYNESVNKTAIFEKLSNVSTIRTSIHS